MKRNHFLICLLLSLFSYPITALPNKESVPNVIVSSRPFYSLVCGIMKNIAEPQLLLQQESSIHHYALRPSEIRSLKKAQIVIWGGEESEPFLKTIISHLSNASLILPLSKTPHLTLLPLRSKHTCNHNHHNHHHNSDVFDPHFWLDPQNAIAMVAWISQELQKFDPENAVHYQTNEQRLAKRLVQLDKDIQSKLKNVKTIPYLVFHDAFQYFESRYHLTQEKALYSQVDSTMNARHLSNIKQSIKEKNIQCILTDTQFQPKILNSLADVHPIKQQTIDEIGLLAPLSEEGYFQMMEDMAQKIKNCLVKK